MTSFQITTDEVDRLNRLANKNLQRALKPYGLINYTDYYSLVANEGTQNRFLNMTVMAEIFEFIKNEDLSKEDLARGQWSYKRLAPYIDRLLEKEDFQGDPDTLQIARLRMAGTFIRYLIYIISLQDEDHEII